MKSLLLSLALAVACSASNVTFDTNSTQLCVGAFGCGVTSVVLGGGETISYTPSTSPLDAPSFASFGVITIACPGVCSAATIPAGLTLYLMIHETQPLPNGNGSLPSGIIAGSIAQSSSTTSITWAPGVLSLGGFDFSVSNSPLALVPPAAGGKTTIQGFVTPTPEPGTWLMLSAGLGLIGLKRFLK